MNAAQRIADELARDRSSSPTAGTVVSIDNTNKLVMVDIEGVEIAMKSLLPVPSVGSTVWIIKNGSDWFIAGSFWS